LNLRAPDALAYAKSHFDTSCPHVHIIISGNLVKSPKKLRLSKVNFRNIQKKIEAYQKEKYPQLEHSIAFLKKDKQRKGIKRTQKEMAQKNRLIQKKTKSCNQKEKIFQIVSHVLLQSESEQEFIQELSKNNISFYIRGKHAGVIDIKA